jgi:hypothetical protein
MAKVYICLALHLDGSHCPRALLGRFLRVWVAVQGDQPGHNCAANHTQFAHINNCLTVGDCSTCSTCNCLNVAMLLLQNARARCLIRVAALRRLLDGPYRLRQIPRNNHPYHWVLPYMPVFSRTCQGRAAWPPRPPSSPGITPSHMVNHRLCTLFHVYRLAVCQSCALVVWVSPAPRRSFRLSSCRCGAAPKIQHTHGGHAYVHTQPVLCLPQLSSQDPGAPYGTLCTGAFGDNP